VEGIFPPFPLSLFLQRGEKLSPSLPLPAQTWVPLLLVKSGCWSFPLFSLSGFPLPLFPYQPEKPDLQNFLFGFLFTFFLCKKGVEQFSIFFFLSLFFSFDEETFDFSLFFPPA